MPSSNQQSTQSTKKGRIRGSPVVHNPKALGLKGANWIGSTASAYWTSTVGGLPGAVFDMLGVFTIIFYLFMATLLHSSPTIIGISVFYMVMVWATVQARTSHDISPRTAGAIIDVGPISRWIINGILGVALGVVFIELFHLVQPAQALPFESALRLVGHHQIPHIHLFGLPLTSLVLFTGTAFWIPIAEEYVFDAFAAPSTARIMGVGLSVPFVAAVWSLVHFGVYHSSPRILAVLFAFRIVAELLTLYTKSMLGGLIAHIMVNTAALLFPA